MMERHDHNNPWADKLQDISIPGENSSWEAMEALLDREMPAGGKKDWRRWVLLVILLLLLIGVCNCPGVRLTGHKGGDGGGRDTAGSPGRGDKVEMSGRSDKVETLRGGDRTETSRGGDTATSMRTFSEADTVGERRSDSWMKGDVPGGDGAGVGGRTPEDAIGGSKQSGNKTNKHSGGKSYRPSGVRNDRPAGGGMIKPSQGGSIDPSKEESRDPSKGGNIDSSRDKSIYASKGNDTSGRKGIDTTAAIRKKNTDSVAAVRNVNKTSKPDSILQVKGWLAGVGLNQFFTVGRQQHSNYNSSGTTGGPGDYIPVPMVRYYFSRKLFVQMEAQFNTPQYTTKDLLGNVSLDSASQPGRVLKSSLYIQKLFYFNLPLSVHYSPISNLYLGGGIQYARLTNGVALYQDSFHHLFGGGPDTLLASKVLSFKNDTAYQKLKTNEFRLLLDIDYNFKRWIIGVRYNRALSNFIDLQLLNNQVTQSRNSSFQVYLRYIIWDGRKKKLLPK